MKARFNWFFGIAILLTSISAVILANDVRNLQDRVEALEASYCNTHACQAISNNDN